MKERFYETLQLENQKSPNMLNLFIIGWRAISLESKRENHSEQISCTVEVAELAHSIKGRKQRCRPVGLES
jgi:hypothetical protein